MTHATLETKIHAVRRLLADVVDRYAPAVFTTSFGAEDMVLFDMIGREFRHIAIATLDTGRLPDATYALWRRAEGQYLRRVDAYFPDTQSVESYVRIHGVNAFYESIAQRKQCCEIRKVDPLRRALDGKRGWITGL